MDHSLLNTSVTDAKISLTLRAQSNPADTARTAIDLLEHIQGDADQTSRRKMLAGVVRYAIKKMGEEKP